jgi:phosphoribosyl-ATP pyrophosphohydrolase
MSSPIFPSSSSAEALCCAFLDNRPFRSHNITLKEAGLREAPASMFTLDDLARAIAERAQAGGEKSYTHSLIAKGPSHCAKKFGEEAVELVIAAASDDEAAVRFEAADVLYHLLVVLRARNVALADVIGELERRTGQSGLEEKAARRA